MIIRLPLPLISLGYSSWKVSATGEVKSILNSSHLKLVIDAAKTLEVFRPIYSRGSMINTTVSDRERFYSCPPHFISAFESALSLSTIVWSIIQATPNVSKKPYGSIDAVFLLDKGWAINFDDGTAALKFATESSISLPGWQIGQTEETLFQCLSWLSAVMPVVIRFEPIMLGYMVRSEPIPITEVSRSP
jgi:hypothetical protein